MVRGPGGNRPADRHHARRRAAVALLRAGQLVLVEAYALAAGAAGAHRRRSAGVGPAAGARRRRRLVGRRRRGAGRGGIGGRCVRGGRGGGGRGRGGGGRRRGHGRGGRRHRRRRRRALGRDRMVVRPGALLHRLVGGKDVVEDQRRNRAAVNRGSAVLGLHRLDGVRVTHPHGDGQVAVGAHEPGVTVVLGGTGLSEQVRIAGIRAGTGSRRDDAVKHRARGGRDRGGDDLLGLDPVLAGVTAVGLHRVAVLVVHPLDPDRILR